MPDPQAFSELLGGLPPQLITFIVAMTPIFELRGAVPLAIFAWACPLWKLSFGLSWAMPLPEPWLWPCWSL